MSKAVTPPPAALPDQAKEPGSGQGMPAKPAREQDGLPGRQTRPKDSAVEASVQLPHERDQSSDMTAAQPDPAVKQAAKDVKRGLTDTSKGAEMDKAYQKLQRG